MAVAGLEGNTLSVYAFIVRADGPVGVRDVTRGVELSSTSVAYHHLQKLETLNLIEKDKYGQYSLKSKASIEGYLWVGKNLVPRLMLYAFFFVGAFIAEINIMLLSLIMDSLIIEIRFIFLTGITLVSMLLFLKEGLGLYRKLTPPPANKK
jgi:hypothetical protein